MSGDLVWAKGRRKKKVRSLVSVSCNQYFVGLPRLAPVTCILSRSGEKSHGEEGLLAGGQGNEQLIENCWACWVTSRCESAIGLLARTQTVNP